MKVLVIGLNPSRKGGSSKSLKKLYEWLDYLNLDVVSFTNLYEGYVIDKTQSQISTIKEYSRAYDKVISLGQTVHRVVLSMDIDSGYLPHPSGLNRLLNNKKYVHQTLELCKNYLRGS